MQDSLAEPDPGPVDRARTAAFRRLRALPPGPERDALRDETICGWLPMAHRLATRFRDRGENMDDLRQVAAMGLVKAVDRYDPERGKAFETYAVPTVTGELKRHFRDHTWDVHVPRRMQDLRNRVRVARRELAQTSSGRAPTCAEISSATGLAEEDVVLGLEALDSYSALSLDAEPAAPRAVCPWSTGWAPATARWTSPWTASPSSRGCANCRSGSAPSCTSAISRT
ncbi:SigB/SigF/SigG family RNA polymerase sigma factor [Streptomyces californicus]